MKHLRLFISAAAFFAAPLLMSGLGGCSTIGSLRIEPIKNQAVPQAATVAPQFERGIYRIDRDRNLFFVLKKHSIDKTTKLPTDQIVVMRVFWEPVGGTTSLNPASLNATFRYIIMTPDAVGMYEGAGFVRMRQNYGAATMSAWVVDGDLRLTESSGAFKDAVGRAVFKGNFSAALDQAATLDETLNAQKEFFARSLEISKRPATQPATLPGANSQPAATLPAPPTASNP